MTFIDYGINVPERSTGDIKTLCPKCSEDRKKKSEKCLSVNVEKGAWNCKNCGWKGGLNGGMAKEYIRPELENSKPLSENIIAWFEKRGISKETLDQMRLTEGEEFMPHAGKKLNTIHFNYFREEELINVKWRSGDKGFKLQKGAELIFYNLDSIKGTEEAIITEGEPDCLSYIECGFSNVVSVPNGAAKGSQKLEYLDNCWEYFKDKKKVYLAVDNDENGISLRDELARRIGVEKCYRVDYKDCKDGNAYMLKYDKMALHDTITNATPFPIEGVIFVKDLSEAVDSLYMNGLPNGKTIGLKGFDDLISFDTGYQTTITGISQAGKSEYLDFMALKLSILHGWKFGVFSPENYPPQLHISKLAEKIIGKPFKGFGKMNMGELQQAKDYINDNFFLIKPKDENFTLKDILEKGRQLVLQHGINALIIDPFNRVEHHIPHGISETNYIGRCLDEISTFKQMYDVHVFLVAHPTKVPKDKQSGEYEVPNLYMINGSANFFNKTDNGFTVYRNFKTGEIEIYIQKVKFKHMGGIGMVKLRWDFNTGRYHEFHPDNSNWLTQELNPVKQPVMTPNRFELSVGEESDEAPF